MKYLKWAGIIILIAIAAIVGLLFVANEPLPSGEEGPAAESLADKMLVALNKPAYDTLKTLRWSFPRGHHFVWNKQENIVNARWGEFEVAFSPDTKEGTAKKAGIVLTGDDSQKAIWKAWSLFANDSFWLVAPYKIRDPNTSRQLVILEDGSEALLVTYNSGGVTPGDSYLWILDQDYRPKAWKMWVEILPVGGMEFTWEGWTQHGYAWFAPMHKGAGPISVDLVGIEVE